jgi:class 3 adenylate cyclase
LQPAARVFAGLEGVNLHVASEAPVARDYEASEMQLLLEEVCCDLSRFEHLTRDGLRPEQVEIRREHYLGPPQRFADIRVAPVGQPHYFIEIKTGSSDEAVVSSLLRKYAQPTAEIAQANRLVVVIDRERRPNWPRAHQELIEKLPPTLQLEIWDRATMLEMMQRHFRIEVRELSLEVLLDIRQAIDVAKGYYAFGGPSPEEYVHDPLQASLLWHFSFWQLRQLRELHNLSPRNMMRPGIYRGVAVILADLSSFSSFVRDTPYPEIIRASLTSFYSKTRDQIVNSGGVLSQFVGDEVVGIFGLPQKEPGFVRCAYEAAQAMLDIGLSVSSSWQQQIDRVQATSGLHIGMAIGDLQVVSLRPFSRMHMGVIGDCVNVAARLMSVAGSGEIVVTNSFHQQLEECQRQDFHEIDAVEAKNVGRIKAWKAAVHRE